MICCISLSQHVVKIIKFAVYYRFMLLLIMHSYNSFMHAVNFNIPPFLQMAQSSECF